MREKSPTGFVIFFALIGGLGPLSLVISGLMGLGESGWGDIWYRPYLAAVARTLRVLATVSILSLLLGTPLGMLGGALRFPLKGLAIGLLLLPLAMPPFLWAIGIQSLQSFFGFAHQTWFDGFWGCVFSGAAVVVALVALATTAALKQTSLAEIEAMRLSGGTSFSVKCLFQRVLPAATGAALIGAILVVSDPGPGQIMGYHGISGDVLVAFSARGDFRLAAIKGIVGAIIFSPLIIFGIAALLRGIRIENLARDIRLWSGAQVPLMQGTLCSIIYIGIPFLMVSLAFAGLIRPLLHRPRLAALESAWLLFSESINLTIMYAAGAGCIAAGLGLLVAFQCRRRTSAIPAIIFLCLVLISLPSAMNALGFVSLGTKAPQEFDFLLRSEVSVALAMGLRYMPVATLLLLRPVLQISQSIDDSARSMGVSRSRRALQILLPLVFFPLAGTFLATAFLAMADVASTVILQPPGGSSFGTHLFSVMDNSSEKVVASLCLVYSLIPIVAFTSAAVVALGRSHILTKRGQTRNDSN